MAEAEEWVKLPLPEQFSHKNWKARKAGYETAAKEFKTAQPNAPIVREFVLDSGLWKGAVGDSNVAAQQEALNAYNAFLDAAGTEGARKTRSSTVAPAVEKGLTGRPAAKQAALESLLLLIELDKADPVVEELLPFMSNKQPKLIVAALSALTSVVHAYGCKVVEPKPVLKVLPKVFGHADKNVRAEAQNLTVELYRWLREAMKPLFWNELKPVQQTDLDKLFEPVKAEPPAKQDRLLRSQQAAREEETSAPADGGNGDEADGAEEAEIDLEPEHIAVDAFSKLPADLGERLGSSKWKDRKDVLDEAYAAVNAPAIEEGPFDELVRGCAKGMKDANIMVVVVAANVIECLAKGLRKRFGKYRSTVLASMLERFKEKKASVTDAIAAACDAVFASTGLGDIQADALEALKSKNPQVKENTAKFLARSLKSTREPPTPEQTKEIAEAAKKLLTESVATLRDAGAEVLGVLWKIMSDRNMLSHLDGVDDIRKAKITEFRDASEVKAKWKPKAAAPPPKPAGGPSTDRKPAAGSKKPSTATKKPAPRPASPPAMEEALPAPRSSSKPASKPLTGAGGLRPPGAGLKPPGSGLQKPGAGLKAPSASTASPKRQGAVLDDYPTTPAPRALAPTSRGLAGRPLGKPAGATTSPPAAPREAPMPSALSSIERQELSDLRAEADIFRQQTSDLRQERMKLTSQIHELQHQNAQLIEDHTRDVLQIKAKETQLVRARSDAETAEDRANSLSREIDRLKREISRLGRHSAGRESPVDFGGSGGGGAPYSGNGDFRPSYGSSRSYNVPPARAYGVDGYGGAVGNGGGEGKENVPEYRTEGKLSGGAAVPNHTGAAAAAAAAARPMSNGSSGVATSASGDGGGAGGDGRGSGGLNGGGSGMNRSQTDGVESWRRAAEVTQNLKARIEMMKARQNIGRGQ